MTRTLYYKNDTILEMAGIINGATGSYINDYTMTVTLKDENGTSVSGVTWPVSMPYVASSNGTYQAVLPSTLQLVPDAQYDAFIAATGAGNPEGYWKINLTCKYRTNTGY